MPTSVRLDRDTEALLARLAQTRKETKSAVLRAALLRLADDGAGQGGEGPTPLFPASWVLLVEGPRTSLGITSGPFGRCSFDRRARDGRYLDRPLVAILHRNDRDHVRCVEAFEGPAGTLADHLLLNTC
jgi:hypothetical protein